mgnify:CR=1 FL=1
MKKEIIIADIDFNNPFSDTKYSKNIIKNLVGNYRFFSEVGISSGDDFSYAPYIYKQLENDIKPSLAKDENDVSVSSIAVEGVGNKEEFVTFNFSMAEWQESTSQQRKELVQQINKKLGDSYYYGIAQTRDNTISASSPDSVKLTKQFGDYYYDYSIIMPTPFAFPNNDTELQKELIENSTKGIYSSVCKIEPVHNFYNKEYQEIANNNSEQLLYNYYSLYYYILENLINF